MRYYTKQHEFYCGIDLHARNMYLCVQDQQANVRLHQKIKAQPLFFLNHIDPFLPDVVVAVECMFTWYWLADLCAENNIPFVLGHALYMKAVHGGKTQNDRIDAFNIVSILRGGNLPMAYVYPPKMRSTRDLLRRRMHMMHHRAELLAHIQNTSHQYCRPAIDPNLAYRQNRDAFRQGLSDHFPDPAVANSIQADLDLIDTLDHLMQRIELDVLRSARAHDPQSLMLLRTTPGIGKILSLVMLYEIHDINRFDRVQQFASYARLVKCPRSSDGKPKGGGGHKIGNVHLKWAFSEAAVMIIRKNPQAMKYKKRLENKFGKGKALSILAHKLGRAVFYMLKRRKAFDQNKFFAS